MTALLFGGYVAVLVLVILFFYKASPRRDRSRAARVIPFTSPTVLQPGARCALRKGRR